MIGCTLLKVFVVALLIAAASARLVLKECNSGYVRICRLGNRGCQTRGSGKRETVGYEITGFGNTKQCCFVGEARRSCPARNCYRGWAKGRCSAKCIWKRRNEEDNDSDNEDGDGDGGNDSDDEDEDED